MTGVLQALEAAIAESPVPVLAYWQGAELFFVSVETVEGEVRHYASKPELTEVQVYPARAVGRHTEAALKHWAEAARPAKGEPGLMRRVIPLAVQLPSGEEVWRVTPEFILDWRVFREWLDARLAAHGVRR